MKPFNLSYYFEKSQLLKFEVLDYESPEKSELVGEFECKLGKLMGSKDQKMSEHLVMPEKINEKMSKKHHHKRGKIIIRAESVDGGNDEIYMKVQANLKKMKFCFCIGHDSPYLVIQRARSIPDFLKDEDDEIKTLTSKDMAVADEELKSMDLIPVAKTEPIVDDINPDFEEIKAKI